MFNFLCPSKTKKRMKMAKSWQMTAQYLISGEESRLGREDYWNHVFLARIAPSRKIMLKMFKILFVIVFSVCMSAAIARL